MNAAEAFVMSYTHFREMLLAVHGLEDAELRNRTIERLARMCEETIAALREPVH